MYRSFSSLLAPRIIPSATPFFIAGCFPLDVLSNARITQSSALFAYSFSSSILISFLHKRISL